MPDFDFAAPERFVAGTVGPPGERVFFLQARQGRLVAAVSLEKQQVSILADRVNDILDEVAGGEASEQAAAVFADDDPLDTPVEDEFRVVAISLAWDPADPCVVIECLDAEPDEPDDEDADSGEVSSAEVGPPSAAVTNRLRVRLNPAQARAFARRAQRIVSAGRPPCPFCGGPLDVSGHICPRSNGYRR
jgi:uncharacterized repeat protein (TIGR03847 family)